MATDEEWTDDTPLAEGLSWGASTVAQLEVCRLGTNSWQMSPAWLAEHLRWPRSDLVVVPAAGPLRNTVAAWAIIELLREASCPILVARRSPRTARVLLATDLAQAILPALLFPGATPRHRPRLGRAPSLFDLPDPREQPSAARTRPSRDPLEISHLNDARLARLLGAAGLRGDLAVVASAPDRPILGEAEVLQAEIVVVGAELSRRFSRPPRDREAETIAFDASCSVLVVPTTSSEPAPGGTCRAS
ncbi:MAG: universal stress protein, partial [Deltaproteobacteria bacterium]|nr:universal stress protein [Deltaproteobacteria bacterium]